MHGLLCVLWDGCDGEPDHAHPIYFGSRDKFTDASVVFDAAEASRCYLSEHATMFESCTGYVHDWKQDEPAMVNTRVR